jgi:4a-hydroxytetrahydrobiopterin dehydratase
MGAVLALPSRIPFGKTEGFRAGKCTRRLPFPNWKEGSDDSLLTPRVWLHCFSSQSIAKGYADGMALEYRMLSADELTAALALLPAWTVEGGLLTKTFSFKTYKDGVVFAAAVGHVADRLDHHPDMLVSYAKVSVSMSTHAVNGLSPFDFELARRIEGLLT